MDPPHSAADAAAQGRDGDAVDPDASFVTRLLALREALQQEPVALAGKNATMFLSADSEDLDDMEQEAVDTATIQQMLRRFLDAEDAGPDR